MTTQHTPGPWEATPFLTPNEDNDPVGIYKVEPAFSQLSELYWSLDPELDDAPGFHERVHGVNAANARLIAAAPELLAALRVIAEDGRRDGWIPSYHWGEAQKAIAKATGEPVMAA